MKVILNATNLHVGGGLQVAASVIDELSRMEQIPGELKILASTDVDNNLRAKNIINSRLNYEVKDSYGLNQLLPSRYKRFDRCSVVFTIFGPLYVWRASFKNIVGFAQPWIIYPKNECYGMLPFFTRINLRLKFWIQSLFFKRADLLIVDLEHVKEGLIRELGIPADRIQIIHSCISSIYLDRSLWQPIDVSESTGCLRLGFLGRNYLHKNTHIFPEIVKELNLKYDIKAKFFVTLTDKEWSECTQEFRYVCVNVGPLSVSQCPMFYESVDAVVFPSLLETFSATPFEAFVMNKPLFASDRNFNRDICGNHAHYFDPLSAIDAARAIASVFLTNGPDQESLIAAREHALNFSNPRDRAKKYLDLLN